MDARARRRRGRDVCPTCEGRDHARGSEILDLSGGPDEIPAPGRPGDRSDEGVPHGDELGLGQEGRERGESRNGGGGGSRDVRMWELWMDAPPETGATSNTVAPAMSPCPRLAVKSSPSLRSAMGACGSRDAGARLLSGSSASLRPSRQPRAAVTPAAGQRDRRSYNAETGAVGSEQPPTPVLHCMTLPTLRHCPRVAGAAGLARYAATAAARWAPQCWPRLGLAAFSRSGVPPRRAGAGRSPLPPRSFRLPWAVMHRCAV